MPPIPLPSHSNPSLRKKILGHIRQGWQNFSTQVKAQSLWWREHPSLLLDIIRGGVGLLGIGNSIIVMWLIMGGLLPVPGVGPIVAVLAFLGSIVLTIPIFFLTALATTQLLPLFPGIVYNFVKNCIMTFKNISKEIWHSLTPTFTSKTDPPPTSLSFQGTLSSRTLPNVMTPLLPFSSSLSNYQTFSPDNRVVIDNPNALSQPSPPVQIYSSHASAVVDGIEIQPTSSTSSISFEQSSLKTRYFTQINRIVLFFKGHHTETPALSHSSPPPSTYRNVGFLE